MSDGPSGRPNVMYGIPALYNTHSYLKEVDDARLASCKEVCIFRASSPCDEDISTLCGYITQELGLTYPNSILECVKYYQDIRSNLRALLQI